MSQPAQSGNWVIRGAQVADSLTSIPDVAPIQVGSKGSSGGYKFSADQVQGVINQWKDLLADLNTDLNNARLVAGVQPPGQEFASGRFIDDGAGSGAGPSGQTLLDQHQRMIQHVENYIDALNKASGKIQQNEADQRGTIGKQGEDKTW